MINPLRLSIIRPSTGIARDLIIQLELRELIPRRRNPLPLQHNRGPSLSGGALTRNTAAYSRRRRELDAGGPVF